MQIQKDNSNLVEQQASLLRRFSAVQHELHGVVAFLWLPGLGQKFSGPRAVRKRPRPVCVTLEVTESGGLTLGGAVSSPRGGVMRYETIFKYEFTQPMAPNAKGSTLSCRNDVIARRALGLLGALVRFGEKKLAQPRAVWLDVPVHPRVLVTFNPGEVVLDEAKLTELASEGDMREELLESYRVQKAQELCDAHTIAGMVLVDSAIVDDARVASGLECSYEDFSPVLGVPHRNPVRNLHEMFNPATAVLAKHGVTDVCDQQTLDAVIADFRQEVVLGERLSDEEILDALCNPSAPVICRTGVEEVSDSRVAAAMRSAAGNSRGAMEATDDDLIRAARNPSEPLLLSRLSVTQIVSAESLHELPAPYSGWLLPKPDWQPARRRGAVYAE